MDRWMSRLNIRGYTLQFASRPQFNGIQETLLSSQEQCLALQAELRELLLKEAISRVPQGEENQGYYSRYFLVPKKTGGMRPILDLSVFNKVIMKRPFPCYCWLAPERKLLYRRYSSYLICQSWVS